MADNKVKRGFFFYLLMFILLIVAFVGICMTIMLFNPGKDVLGFCYYKNNINQKITVTTDESETEIKIDEKNSFRFSYRKEESGYHSITKAGAGQGEKTKIYQ